VRYLKNRKAVQTFLYLAKKLNSVDFGAKTVLHFWLKFVVKSWIVLLLKCSENFFMTVRYAVFVKYRKLLIPVLDFYQSCKIFQIYQIYEYELGKCMSRIVHICFPGIIACCYAHVNERHNYPTRIATNNNHATPSSKKYLTRRSIQCTGLRLWSNIPKDLKKWIIPGILSNMQKILTGSSYAVIISLPSDLSPANYLF